MNRNHHDRYRRLASLAPALAVAGALALGSGAFVAASGRGADGFVSPLDRYPGFGQSAEAALRDDTIALWEAHQREVLTAKCMEQVALAYEPAVAFPSDAVVAVARGLGIEPNSDAAGLVPAVERNNQLEGSMRPEDRERYFQSLYGESAEDVLGSRASGEVPEDDPGFATGGCVGEAARSLPGLWELRRALDPVLVGARREARDHVLERNAAASYAVCASDAAGTKVAEPSEVEGLVADGQLDNDVGRRVLDECDWAWREVTIAIEERAARSVLDDHGPALVEVARRYEGIMGRIAADQPFREHLANELTLLAGADDGA